MNLPEQLNRHLAVLFLLLLSNLANAHGEAMILGMLLYFGLGGGMVGGILVVATHRDELSFAWPFAWFLAVLCVVAAVWASSVEIVPYAIAYASFASVLPFVLTFYATRYLAVRVRQYFRSRRK